MTPFTVFFPCRDPVPRRAAAPTGKAILPTQPTLFRARRQQPTRRNNSLT